jgi:hypothetical protein
MNDPSPEEVELARQNSENAKKAVRDAKHLMIRLVVIGVVIGAITAIGIAKLIGTLDSTFAPTDQQERQITR